MDEIYISVDVESDGPIPGPHSMLSLGAAAFLPNGDQVGLFEANLETLEGAAPDRDTMEWWSTQPEAWEICHKNLQPPEQAIRAFVAWIERTAAAYHSDPVCVGYPTGFDFTFVHWYNVRFAGRDPLGFSALDIRSHAMGVLKTSYKKSSQKHLPKEWLDNLPPLTHRAVDDAVRQGVLFINILKANAQS